MAPYLLLVESDPELQQRIGNAFREASYELATEAEGVWARRSVLIRPPDAVILDTALNDGSGFAVAEALRRDPETEKVPIFFVASRFRGAKHRSEARRRFAPAEYLTTSPVDLDTLLARVLETVPPRAAAAAAFPADYPAPRVADPAQKRERREVEEEARKLSTRAAGWRGTIARDPFARILARLYLEKKSGTLLLVRDRVKKIVYFRDGYPVSVRSNVLGECLGQILLARRLIDRGILEESLERMRAERRHQGAILVEMGALSPHNLTRALIGQMEAKLYELFSWQAGSFRFTETKQPVADQVTLQDPPAALILEGVRRHYDADRQTQVLERFDGQYVAASADPRQRLQDLSTDPDERAFALSIDGSKRLAKLLDSTRLPARDARLLLVAMAEAGMIEPARAPARRSERERDEHGERPHRNHRERIETESNPLELSDKEAAAEVPYPGRESWQRPPDRRSREELEALYEGMLMLSYFDVLGVSEEAGQGEIDRAYEARAREFHPDRFRSHPQELRDVARRIFECLGEAHATLFDPGRRRRYVQRLEREREEPAPAITFHSPPAAAEEVYYAGVEQLRQRRYHEAAGAFRQAVTLAPAQASYHGALGWAIYRSAPADATAVASGRAELERAVQLGEGDPWVHVSLGRFHAETGAPDRAVHEFELALQLNPGLADVEEELRRLRSEI
jgi:DNA-binding response OmpR family regulator/tetratricopeptide (TPR) repeat protein